MPLTQPLPWLNWLPTHLQTRFVLPTLDHSHHLCCALCAGVCVCVFSRFSPVRLCVTPQAAARQASLSMEVSRQEYWSGLPCLPPGDLPSPGIKPVPPAL